jgi:hypothetical protein
MGRCCFCGLSAAEPGCCFRFARVVPLVPFIVPLLKLFLEVVLIVREVVEGLGGVEVKESGLEGRRMEGCDGKALVVTRLAKDLPAMVLSIQNEWCLSRAYIKSSYHPAGG